ncbi:MAG: FMN-binding protein [Dorea sp.]
MEKEKIMKKIKEYAPAASIVLVAACVGTTLGNYSPPTYEVQAKETVNEEQAGQTNDEAETVKGSFNLPDGVYKGTGTGYAGEITVAVQIQNKEIVSIDILSFSDDAAFSNRAKAVIDRIIEKQSLDVDVVSGATYSSNGIISAVKNALTGEEDSGETGQSQSGNQAAEGSSKTVEAVTDAAAYKDGAYYGTGTGFGGTLKVKVTISGGKINAIEIVETKDGSEYIKKAAVLLDKIIAGQTTNVDTVSGATYSSSGLIQAVRDALKQAAIDLADTSSNLDTDSTTDNNTEGITGTIPYNEGIYYGSAEGYNGDVKVAVVAESHYKGDSCNGENDDADFFNRAMTVVKNIMKQQSTDVDIVSGATYSSNGLIGAVKNALKEAEKVTNGETADTKPDTTALEKALEEAEALQEEQYTESTWAVLTVRIQDAKAVLASEPDQTTVDQAFQNLKQAIRLLEKKDGKEDEGIVYNNGIYEGRSLCVPDDDADFEPYNLTLKITVRNDKIVAITDIQGDGASDNQSYIQKAAYGKSGTTGVVDQILNSGVADNIDVVSRATCSSNAIMEACKNALEGAKK